MRGIVWISVVATVAGRPAELEDSISSVLASLQERSPARPRIITKADFLPSSRHQKAGLLDLPPEFTVSTDLTVSQPDLQQADNSRRGRMYGELRSAVAAAPLITGVRLPDDETDRVVHRGGRFINNVFIPDSAAPVLPSEVVVRTEVGGRLRSGRAFSGPGYSFSPAAAHPAPLQSAVLPAQQGDFVIQEKTYQSCPGCPTFSIPVPVPVERQEAAPAPSLADRLAALVRPVVERARQVFRPVDRVTNRMDTVSEAGVSGGLLGSLAALGLGLLSLYSVQGEEQTGARRMDQHSAVQFLNNDVEDYSVGELLCLPRVYCEQLRASKHILDQYPNMKIVANWVTDKYFENVDDTESKMYSECNIRECLKDLLQ